MSETSEFPRKLYTLNRGFSLTRFVVGAAMSELAHKLDEVANDDGAVELRMPHEENDDGGMIDARMGAKFVKQSDIQRLKLRNSRIPLRVMYKEIDRSLPGLKQPIQNVTLESVYETPGDMIGGRYFAVGFDPNTARQLSEERTSVINGVINYVGAPGENWYPTYQPDATIFYLGPESHPESEQRLLGIVRDHLPLPVELNEVVRYPDNPSVFHGY
jgi:hypothetical protein